MRSVRATLIQCISEFRACLQPFLQPVVERYGWDGAVFEDALKYVLAEEIELIYLLFDRHHSVVRRMDPYRSIYHELRRNLPYELSVLVSHYISVPRVYDDSEIDVRLKGQDLLIHYHRDPFGPPPESYNTPQLLLEAQWDLKPEPTPPRHVDSVRKNYSKLVE